MKNKALTYVLIFVVGIIWYQVFMRVRSSIVNEEGITTSQNNVSNFKPIQRDTFTLKADYRDPFGGAPIQEVSVINEPQNLPPVLPKRKVEEPWPVIHYYGMVRKVDSNSPLGIVSIDGIQLRLRKGERIFDNIFIEAISRESVSIVYKKKKRVFYRE